MKKILDDCLKQPDNKVCAECGMKQPRWASTNLGIFMCIRCSGIHRNLGVHISKVKSVSLDTWPLEQADFMATMGNEKSNAVWEYALPSNRKPTENDTTYLVEQFIKDKYEKRMFVKPEKKKGKAKKAREAERERGREKEREKDSKKKAPPKKKKPASESDSDEDSDSDSTSESSSEDSEDERAAAKKKKAAAAAAKKKKAAKAKSESEEDESEEEEPKKKAKAKKADKGKKATKVSGATHSAPADSQSANQPTHDCSHSTHNSPHPCMCCAGHRDGAGVLSLVPPSLACPLRSRR